MNQKKLQKILDLHKKWINGDTEGQKADLGGANLSDANLSGADLRCANLRCANLSDADLSKADLSKADLGGANLSDANLSGADLRCANLRCANLSDADLSKADLSKADLGGANLSGTQGVLDAIDYIRSNFERTEEGYIAYKTFGSTYEPPERWRLENGEVITESCNPDRTCECGCGINVATLEWVKENSLGKIYKLLIRYEWLAGVVVPYMTDGKIRTSRAQIIGVVD